eukprot:766018-Hanusia_phi.AAC.2
MRSSTERLSLAAVQESRSRPLIQALELCCRRFGLFRLAFVRRPRAAGAAGESLLPTVPAWQPGPLPTGRSRRPGRDPGKRRRASQAPASAGQGGTQAQALQRLGAAR